MQTMAEGNKCFAEREAKPRSNAYQYVIHRIHETGAGVNIVDSLDDAIDTMTTVIRMAKDTELLHVKCYRDDLVILWWHNSVNGIYMVDVERPEKDDCYV